MKSRGGVGRIRRGVSDQSSEAGHSGQVRAHRGSLEPGVSRHQSESKSEGLEGWSVRSVGSCGLRGWAWPCWWSAGPVGEEECARIGRH